MNCFLRLTVIMRLHRYTHEIINTWFVPILLSAVLAVAAEMND